MISLRPMNETEFETFLARSSKDYAIAKVQAGNWPADEADERARQALQSLLPQGLATPKHHFFTIQYDEHPAGGIWLSTYPKAAGGAGYIYDLHVHEGFRRKGIAHQAMLLLEAEARKLGVQNLALHVFGHNQAARALYEKLGYSITMISMSKTLAA